MSDAPKNQRDRIWWTLEAAWPNEVPAMVLSKIALQFGARIHELRKMGILITNRIVVVRGVKHSYYKLGPKPVPRSKELRAQRAAEKAAAPPANDTLFDITPIRYPE